MKKNNIADSNILLILDYWTFSIFKNI
jgi:hypothetical protein